MANENRCHAIANIKSPFWPTGFKNMGVHTETTVRRFFQNNSGVGVFLGRGAVCNGFVGKGRGLLWDNGAMLGIVGLGYLRG